MNPAEVTTCGHCGAKGVMRGTIDLDHRQHADDCPRVKDRDDK